MECRQRHLEGRLSRLRRAVPIILVLGARQAGKSTLLSHVAPETRRAVFDPVIDVGNDRQDPELFLDQYPPPVIPDEVQYVPDLLAVIKRRVDEDRRPDQYLLTDSQNPMLLDSVSELDLRSSFPSMLGTRRGWTRPLVSRFDPRGRCAGRQPRSRGFLIRSRWSRMRIEARASPTA